jgi:6-pyruvoyltetrahydropterin/6-carboxytetrahydropterin synthase
MAHWEIEVTDHFAAAHRLREQGSACENVHGHNWFVTVFARCDGLDRIGLGIDFKIVKSHLHEILDGLDHKDLNCVPPFDTTNPSTEHLARFVWERMSERLAGSPARIARVRVSEGPNTAATYVAGE